MFYTQFVVQFIFKYINAFKHLPNLPNIFHILPRDKVIYVCCLVLNARQQGFASKNSGRNCSTCEPTASLLRSIGEREPVTRTRLQTLPCNDSL